MRRILMMCVAVAVAFGVNAGEYAYSTVSRYQSAPVKYDRDYAAIPELTSKHTFSVSSQQRFVKMKNRSAHIGWSRTETTSKASPTAVALSYTYNPGQWRIGSSVNYEHINTKTHRDFYTPGAIFNGVYVDGSNTFTYMKTREQNVGVTLFGGADLPQGFYLDGIAHLGFDSTKLKEFNARVVHSAGGVTQIYSPNGTDHSVSFAGSIEVGKNFNLVNGFRITPHVEFAYAYKPSSELDYTYTPTPGFTFPRTENREHQH